MTLAGCGTPAEAPEALPEGVTASVLQTRSDVVDGRLVVQIDNGTDGDLTIDRLDVSAPGLEDGMVLDGPKELSTGKSVQVRLDLVPVRCDGDAGPATIGLELQTATGPASGAVEAGDPYDTLARLQETGCLARSVERIATFTLPERLRTEGTGEAQRAWIDIAVEPTGDGDGSLSIAQILGTTLLSAEGGLNWPYTADIAATDPPTTIELPVRPARCDQHAGAEDKRGTIIPLEITTSDGWSGLYELRSGQQLKDDFFAYFTERCGLG
ncbi:hypothetical protein [Agromyces aerolatus]|uniref:hypothetical protein n=1 Tax=Agromyces sp. LY-1074 TaxID=3074080 RepID=UPI00285CFD8E|nr:MULTISPECIES: hypothetical protein [unclassified Agromyces]MDR5698922.1 hypothetical protein [Agromyces sp. LY-1074]MDR5705300.1 hypothetical protein [Agromyces sp. LY-1358]